MKNFFLQKETRSALQTMKFAESFAKKLRPGEIVAFSGDLGSGKTTFIKGLAKGLGLRSSREVKSPTFALMHVYPSKTPLYHFDLYRLETAKDLEAIGFFEFIHNPDVVVSIEWAEKAKKFLPRSIYRVTLEITGPKSRLATIRRS